MKAKKSTLKNGNPRAPGGKRKNAGRKPDKLKAEMAKIGDPKKILQFFYDVATGKDMEQVVTDAGETVRVPASVKDRLRAGELYLDRQIGKVKQEMEHSGSMTLEQLVGASRTADDL